MEECVMNSSTIAIQMNGIDVVLEVQWFGH